MTKIFFRPNSLQRTVSTYLEIFSWHYFSKRSPLHSIDPQKPLTFTARLFQHTLTRAVSFRKSKSNSVFTSLSLLDESACHLLGNIAISGACFYPSVMFLFNSVSPQVSSALKSLLSSVSIRRSFHNDPEESRNSFNGWQGLSRWEHAVVLIFSR